VVTELDAQPPHSFFQMLISVFRSEIPAFVASQASDVMSRSTVLPKLLNCLAHIVDGVLVGCLHMFCGFGVLYLGSARLQVSRPIILAVDSIRKIPFFLIDSVFPVGFQADSPLFRSLKGR